jgi:integrase
MKHKKNELQHCLYRSLENFVMKEIDRTYNPIYPPLENNVLQNLALYSNITPKDMLHNMIMTKRDKLLKQHKTPITYLENKGRWYTRLPDKSAPIILKNKSDVEDRVIEYYLALEKSLECTLTNIFSDFIAYRSIHKSVCTVADDVYYYENYIAPYEISEKDIATITRQEFKNWAIDIVLNYNMTKKYFRNVRSTFNKLMNYAEDCEFITSNHLKSVDLSDILEPLYKATSEHELHEDALNVNEINQLTQLIKADNVKEEKPEILGILLLLLTGIRVGELCALQYRDFDRFNLTLYLCRMQRDKYVEINGSKKKRGYEVVPWLKKGSRNNPKHRKIKINHEVIECIDTIRAINKQLGYPTEDSDYIFYRKNKETHYEIDMCNHRVFDTILRNYCKQCNFNYIYSPHDLRRTYASNLHNSGVSIEFIRRQLGHTTVEMTMKYLRDVTEPEVEDTYFMQAMDVLSGNVNKCQQNNSENSNIIKIAEAS